MTTLNSTGPEQIPYPSETKEDSVRYVLKKYMNNEMCYKATFRKLSDRKLERILKDIKGETQWQA